MAISNYARMHEKQIEDLILENERLKKDNRSLRSDITFYKQQMEYANSSKEKMKAAHKDEVRNLNAVIEEKDLIIQELRNCLAREAAKGNHDGTNTGIPTSQTPIGKDKVNPHKNNSRTESDRKRGGQPGHSKKTMKVPDDSRITKDEYHEPEKGMCCPDCGCETWEVTDETIDKVTVDVEIVVHRIKHHFVVCKCADCGTEFHVPIEKKYKEPCQYGENVQAMALSMMNTANVPINKVKDQISGMTNNEINLSEGFIAKLQRRAAAALTVFIAELYVYILTRTLLYWDDTVIFVNQKRACLRFYGDETISYYTAHEHKDLDGLMEDNILPLLAKDVTVMHDHNRVNYNPSFIFRNIECNQHLQRDMKKMANDSGYKEWTEAEALISKTIHDRKALMEKGEDHFEEAYISAFHLQLDTLLEKIETQNEKDNSTYFYNNNQTLVKRIREYRDNYFLWLSDFTMPTTDNLSERGLRCIKSHQKISGQFQNISAAGRYAVIKTYLETCRKNGINEYIALNRMIAGKPFTVAEIFHLS